MSAASQPKRPATLAARAGVESDRQHGAVMPPLHLSVNYAFEASSTLLHLAAGVAQESRPVPQNRSLIVPAQ